MMNPAVVPCPFKITTLFSKKQKDVYVSPLSYVPHFYHGKQSYDENRQFIELINLSRRWSRYSPDYLEGDLEYKVRVLKFNHLNYLRRWIICLTKTNNITTWEEFYPPPLEFWTALKKELDAALVQLLKIKDVVQTYREELEAEMAASAITDKKQKIVRDGLDEYLREMETSVSTLTYNLETRTRDAECYLNYQIQLSGLPQKINSDTLSNVFGYL